MNRRVLIVIFALISFIVPRADAQQSKKNPFPAPHGEELPADQFRELRTWTDISGKFTTRAKLAGVTSGKVKLQRFDDSQFTVYLSILSPQDREWIKQHTTKAGKPIATKEPADTNPYGPAPEKPAKKVNDETKARLLPAIDKGMKSAALEGLSEEDKIRVLGFASYFKGQLNKGNDPRVSTDDLFSMDSSEVRLLRTFFPDFINLE